MTTTKMATTMHTQSPVSRKRGVHAWWWCCCSFLFPLACYFVFFVPYYTLRSSVSCMEAQCRIPTTRLPSSIGDAAYIHHTEPHTTLFGACPTRAGFGSGPAFVTTAPHHHHIRLPTARHRGQRYSSSRTTPNSLHQHEALPVSFRRAGPVGPESARLLHWLSSHPRRSHKCIPQGTFRFSLRRACTQPMRIY
jgi:hypothetical protein